MRAFVAMPFDDAFWPVFQAMRTACEQLDIEPRRVDQLAHVANIHTAIFAEIEACDVVIADFSADRTPGHPNTNVITEAAYAHGKGIPQIVLTQDTKTLTFDWATKRAIIYQNSETGLAILVERLTDALREMQALRASGSNTASRETTVDATASTEGPLPRAVAVLLEHVEEAWRAGDVDAMQEHLDRIEKRGYRTHPETIEWWINCDELRTELVQAVLNNLTTAWQARDVAKAHRAYERLLRMLPADHPDVTKWPQLLSELEDRTSDREQRERDYEALLRDGSTKELIAAHEAFLRQYPNAPQADMIRRTVEDLRKKSLGRFCLVYFLLAVIVVAILTSVTGP